MVAREPHAIDAASISQLIADRSELPEIEPLLPSAEPSPLISPATGRLLARLILTAQARSVLEYGAGSSSVVIANALAMVGGGRLTSVEHMPQYSRESWARVEQVHGVDARLVASKLELSFMPAGLFWSYPEAEPALRARGPFDLVFVDAPPKSFGRDAPLFQALPFAEPGCIIVLDDARRRRERGVVRRWLRGCTNVELLAHDTQFGGRGVAVLRVTGAGAAQRFSPLNLVESVYEQWVHYRRMRRGRQTGAE